MAVYGFAVKGIGNVWWAMLGLVEDAAEVLADDADGKELASAEEENDDDEGGEALNVIAHGYGLDEEIKRIEHGSGRADQADDGGQSQWRGGVGGDAFDGEVAQAAQIERRVSSVSFEIGIQDFFFAEAYPCIHALGVSLGFAQAAQRIQGATIQQAKVAHVGQDVDACRALKHLVI